MGHPPLDCASAVLDGTPNAYLLRFAHRALAARDALSCLSSGVKVSKLRFPPILPPFFPIADITREISLEIFALGLGGVGGSAVERSTMRNAA
jgi:hypothetical protein